ncbi:MAG: 4Fe-4S dicluster domain-containing protein [Desulfobacterales bacterium]
MKAVKIDKAEWDKGLEKLRNEYRLFGPVKEKDACEFKELAQDEKPDLSGLNTRMSAKSLIYPQTEAMFTYTLDETAEDHHILKPAEKDYSPRAVIGIRPCDAHAFLLVRRNFDTPEYKDPYWLKAYEATTFVGFACANPAGTCFCTSAGSGPFNEAGLDVLLVEREDGFLAKSVTQKGEALLEAAGWSNEISADEAQKEIEALKAAAEEKITSAIDTDRLKEMDAMMLYNAPFWEDVAFSCINCGTCTFVCPTCWCFDIQDESHKTSGVRMRNWDSCMFPLFTLHGSGHNPRGDKVQRVRQRFMHKLKYYVDKYGDGIQCVGCGRCIRACPVNIDIRQVCERMNSYDDATCAAR